jgi:hypothetical protein
VLRAAGYLRNVLSVERFDGDWRQMYALRKPLRRCRRLTRIVVNVVGGLISGDDVFTRPSVAQLAVLSASERKHWDGCQGLKMCVLYCSRLPCSVKTTLKLIPATALMTLPPP